MVDPGPESAVVNFYDPLTLVCLISGSPKPNIVWYRDGREVAREGSSLLRIEEILLSDQGTYTCTATNSEGSVASAPAYVRLNGN